MRRTILVGAVILNYNSSTLSIKTANILNKYSCFDKIVIVDNCSSEEQVSILKAATLGIKIKRIFNNRNCGYAAGNNLGLKSLVNIYNCDVCFIVNPDVIVLEETCIKIVTYLRTHKEYGVISSIRTDINGNFSQRQFWNLPSYSECMKECFWSYRKKIQKNDIYCIDSNDECIDVDVIPGSFMAISAEALKNVNYLDESTFLYNEENCLAQRMKKSGYKEGILCDVSYIHNHIKPNKITDSFVVFKRGYDSKKAYITNYIIPELNVFQKVLLLCCYKFCYLERLCIYKFTRR